MVAGQAKASVAGVDKILPFRIIDDVVRCGIPMLLSRSSLKTMSAEIDFKALSLRLANRSIVQLFVGATGHLQIPVATGSLSRCKYDAVISTNST